VITGVDISKQAIKYFILNSQSITTIIFSQHLLSGSLIIKSIKISLYLQFRTGSGFKRPLYILYKASAC
jgi:predicted membrane chloride channel (bestrophin family)